MLLTTYRLLILLMAIKLSITKFRISAKYPKSVEPIAMLDMEELRIGFDQQHQYCLIRKIDIMQNSPFKLFKLKLTFGFLTLNCS